VEVPVMHVFRIVICILLLFQVSARSAHAQTPQAATTPFDHFKTGPQPNAARPTAPEKSSAEELARLLNKGTTERRTGDFKAAIATLSAAIDAAPASAVGYSERALAHMAASAYDAALADLDKALQLLGDKGAKSQITQNLINRGLVFQQQSKYDRAITDFDRAISLEPDNATALADRALVYVLMKKWPDKAVADAQRAVELRPNYEFGHYVRGLAFLEGRRFEQATADFMKVLQGTPDHRGAILGLKRADLKGADQEADGSVVLVRSADAACEPTCAEWISIQGRIVAGMSDQLKPIIKGLGGRKVPVFVDSGGGSVSEAMDMGKAIRAAGLDVAVTRTLATECAKTDAACRKRQGGAKLGTPRGEAAVCASSCGFLLAAGTRRGVGKSALVGVHQITSFQTYQEVFRRYEVRKEWQGGKLVEVDRRLISEERGEKKTVATETKDTSYARVRTFYTDMGTDVSIMSLLVSAPAKGMYWLTPSDLARTRARTDVADGKMLLAGMLQPPPAAGAAPQPTVPAVVTVYTLPSDSDVALTKAIQIQLKRIGCSPGNDDGKWGAGVRRALERYNTLTGRPLELEGPSGNTLDALSSQKGLVCPVQ
jgi:hypothetical protein